MAEFQIGNAKYNIDNISAQLKLKKADVGDADAQSLFEAYDMATEEGGSPDGELSVNEAKHFVTELVKYDTAEKGGNADNILSEDELKKFLKDKSLEDKSTNIIQTFLAKIFAAAAPAETEGADKSQAQGSEGSQEGQLTAEQQVAVLKQLWESQETIKCYEVGGRTQPIEGALATGEINEQGLAKDLTIVNNRSGNTFKFELAGQSEDGAPLYKCTAMKTKAGVTKECTSTNDLYALAQNETTHALELVQTAGMTGHGKGLKFGSAGSGSVDLSEKQRPPLIEDKDTNDDPTPEVPENKGDKKEEVPTTKTNPTTNNTGAEELGKKVAEDLIGYTDGDEIKDARDNFTKVNKDNVVDFLKAYNDEKMFKNGIKIIPSEAIAGAGIGATIGASVGAVGGLTAIATGVIGTVVGLLGGAGAGIAHTCNTDGFFEQLYTEIGDDWNNEQVKYVKDIAGKLADYAKEHDKTEEEKQIREIIAKSELTEDDCDKLDDIAEKIIK